jgi:hypothetical protein
MKQFDELVNMSTSQLASVEMVRASKCLPKAKCVLQCGC